VNLRWYVRRLSAMGPAEVVARVRHRVVHRAWRPRHVARMADDPALHLHPSTGAGPDDTLVPAQVPAPASAALVAAAESVLSGRWEQFGLVRTDFVDPDWFLDPTSGRRAPAGDYAFRINVRDPRVVGNIKHVWEPSRHHHLTLLAMAWHVTRDERYAERAAAHLRSWWSANPFLSGVHWTSGIELGIRLISWCWTRRLLSEWAGVGDLFDDNPTFRAQLHHHQEYLSRLHSTGSSANNHVIAEAAGLVVTACAFPWFPESARWRSQALELLVTQLDANTFGSGLNKELATEYHGLVLELALTAAAELETSGVGTPGRLWELIVAMFDALATVVDCRLQPPRQGDADSGRVLLLDAPDSDRWASLLATGAAVLGAMDWWPPTPEPDVRATVLGSILQKHANPPRVERPMARRALLRDAGLALIRSDPHDGPEIWCRADSGPHGFLSIAAHTHADALAVELRVDGVDVIADPGTYCYHGEPEWRAYFRGTRSHATLELGGVDQSTSAGPFLWSRHAASRLIRLDDDGDRVVWSAQHDGYAVLDPPAVHVRTLVFERRHRRLCVEDRVDADGEQPCRLMLPMGPDVELSLAGSTAEIRWPGMRGAASMELDSALSWTALRGDVDPPMGWYSGGFGHKTPAWLLVGRGTLGGGRILRTVIELEGA
jgi:hypothetical protein